MSTAPSLDAIPDVDFGRLANNFMDVQALRTALSRAETNSALIPKLVARILRKGSWQEWIEGDGDYHGRWKLSNPADFREFISDPIKEDGCGCPLHVFERMILETEAWDPYLLTRGDPGGNNNPYGRAGKPDPEINRDDITVDSPDTRSNRDEITVRPGVPPTDGVIASLPISQGNPRQRDYKREAPTGTSTSYNLRRLERGSAGKPARPDLLAKVKAGEMTPWAACVEAGFVRSKVTLESDPIAASRVILRHFAGDDLLTLQRELANHAGDDVLPLLRELAGRLGYDLVERI